MNLSGQKHGLCAFCSFRGAERFRPSLQRRNGGRQFHLNIHRVPSPQLSKEAASARHYFFKNGRDADISVPLGKRRLPRPAEVRANVRRVIRPLQDPDIEFWELVNEQMDLLLHTLLNDKTEPYTAYGIKSADEFVQRFTLFRQFVERGRVEESPKTKRKNVAASSLYPRLRKAFLQSKPPSALYAMIKFAFIDFSIQPKLSEDLVAELKKLADLRYPVEWYPATRALQREIHLHVGPTNSGKTYQALKRLEEAKTGIYAGPLRLLAHEVYSRLNAKGKLCALITGEERRVPEGMKHLINSCTVEMVPLNAQVDVAVIDEIQMLADENRGWAWTQALLGVQAKEVHLCGELRTVELVTKLCKLTGDKLIVHRYDRLSKLETMNVSLKGRLDNLQKGDAIILFSRIGLHAMKTEVEKATGKRCAIVYGSLPPETRAQQAALFNDPDNDYDFLVASDAVGMGLNLSIKRIIFESTTKHNGTTLAVLQTSDIKQIAGRAGRFKSASEAINKGVDIEDGAGDGSVAQVVVESPNVGLVTTLEPFDLPIVKQALKTEVEPIKAAGIYPPGSMLVRFANLFPQGTPLSYILMSISNMARLDGPFFMCDLDDTLPIADCIQHLPLMPVDRFVFSAAPVRLHEPGVAAAVKEFAACIANRTTGTLLGMKCLDLELLEVDINDPDFKSLRLHLRDVEQLHKVVSLYLWLSYRFGGTFPSQALAFHTKELIEARINECLENTRVDEKSKQKYKLTRQQRADQYLKKQKSRSEAQPLGIEEGGAGVKGAMPEVTEKAVKAEKSKLVTASQMEEAVEDKRDVQL